MPVKRVGITGLVEQPREWKKQGGRIFLTRTWESLNYDIAQAQFLELAQGDQMDDIDATNLFIEDMQMDGMPGAMGRLVVRLSTLEGGSSGSITAPEEPADTAPVFEREWVLLEKDIRVHPRFLTGGTYALTPTDRAQLGVWESEPDAVLKAAYKYSAGGTHTLSANAQILASKLLNGETHYLIFTPVARRTTFGYAFIPVSTNVGLIESPPANCGAPTDVWQYMKTADRAIRKWGQYGERVEEWTGANLWDTVLYPVKAT